MKAKRFIAYCGDYPNQKKYGKYKIGMTQDSASSRQRNISKSKGHQFIMNIIIEVPMMKSKAELTKLESDVRYGMSLVNGLTFDESSNDHFDFTIIKGSHKKQVESFGDYFLMVAEASLKEMGYSLAKCKVTRR